MKKTFSAFLILLLLWAGTGVAGEIEMDFEAQEVDFAILLDTPGFAMAYDEDGAPLWFYFEDRDSLVDENGRYIFPCVSTVQTELGNFMVLQLDAGHYAAQDDMIGMTRFSILVEEVEYTFARPHVAAFDADEFGMVLCGQDALAMVKGIAATEAPVYIVLEGERGNLAYEMTGEQRSTLQALAEGGERAGLFESELALAIADAYTPVTVSDVSVRSKAAVAAMGTAGGAIYGPVVELGNGMTLANESIIMHTAQDDRAHYTENGCFLEPVFVYDAKIEPLGSGYYFALAVGQDDADTPPERVTIIADGRAFPFDIELTQGFLHLTYGLIPCGEAEEEMIEAIIQAEDPVKVIVTTEGKNVAFVMTQVQLTLIREFWAE